MIYLWDDGTSAFGTKNGEGGSNSGGGGGTLGLSENDLYLIHGLMMAGAWVICGFALFLSNRWVVFLCDKMQYVHTFFGFLAMFLTLAGTVLVVLEEGIEIELWHTFLGWVILVGVVLISFGGIISYRYKTESEWDTTTINFYRMIHRRMAVFLMLLSIPCIATGIDEHLEDGIRGWDWLMPTQVGGTLVLFFLCEFLFRQWRRREGAYNDQANVPVINAEEFETRVRGGENL